MTGPSTKGRSLRIVVSGGMGSGKSTVLARLRELGVAVIEADVIGHEVLQGGEAFDAVAGRWPQTVVSGAIDRAALAQIVFADVGELRHLEAMTHPAIAAEIGRRVADAHGRSVAVELPVGSDLVGAGWLRVVVEAPEEVRVTRAVERGGNEIDVRRRIAVQPTAEEWRVDADYVIENDGTKAELIATVDKLWAALQEGIS